MHLRKIITLAFAISIVAPSFAETALAGPKRAAPDSARPKSGDKKVKRLTLVGIDNAVRFVAQTQPKEIHVDKPVPWTKSKTSTGDRPELEFTRAEGRTMTFELAFDTSESNADVHDAYVAKLLSLAMVMDPNGSEEKKRPPRVKVLGIGSIAFEGVIESVAVRYTMFTSEGVPVRATCTVKIKEASRASFKRGTSGASG